MTRPFHYSAYDLAVTSDLALPGLQGVGHPGSDPDPVVVRLGELDEQLDGDGSPPRLEETSREEARLLWGRAGVLTIRRGAEVLVSPRSDAHPETLAAFVVAQALPLLLVQRGFLVLHGSAVERDGRAVAFLGGGQAGKSTAAAALAERGWRVVSDDVVAVTFERGCVRLLPGPPNLKLWPDTVTHFGGSPDGLARVRPTVEKRFRPVEPGSRRPVDLDQVYVLRRGEQLALTPLRARAALLALMPHLWAAPTAPAAQERLAACARLASTCPVSLLDRPPDLVLLAQVARLVEEKCWAEALA